MYRINGQVDESGSSVEDEVALRERKLREAKRTARRQARERGVYNGICM